MFVRWITKDGVEFLYECSSAIKEPLIDQETREVGSFLLVLQDSAGMNTITLDIEKDGDQLYFMNNDGKTIDKYHYELKGKK